MTITTTPAPAHLLFALAITRCRAGPSPRTACRQLSRAADVPASTGLGRRKRREREVDLPDRVRITETAVR